MVISKIYPGLPVERSLLLFGVKIPDLKTFTEIIKSDDELSLKEFLAMFSKNEDAIYSEDISEEIEEIFLVPSHTSAPGVSR